MIENPTSFKKRIWSARDFQNHEIGKTEPWKQTCLDGEGQYKEKDSSKGEKVLSRVLVDSVNMGTD